MSLKRRTSKPKQAKPLPFTEQAIQERAYELWQANPEGSSESHWQGAIEALKRERSLRWNAKRLLGLAFTAETPSAALDVVKVVVSALALLVSALGLLATVTAGVGLYLNYQQGHERLITDRFAKAVEQLGSKEPDVRIGATYSLERIAKDSPKDHWTIMEVLTAFVRTRSKLPKDWKPDSKQQLADVTTDVQSALTVIGRREVRQDRKFESLNLQSTNLRGANLRGANLIKFANFEGANLTGANLIGANLLGARLFRANLEGARLTIADLKFANLEGAHLRGADLRGANLEFANLLGTRGITPAQVKQADNWEKAYYSSAFRQQLGLPPEDPNP